MPSINEVIERVSRVRPDAYDDETKALWILELDGQLAEEFFARYERDAELIRPERFPEDGDVPLCVDAPYDRIYDLYVMAQIDAHNREADHYNNSAALYESALDDFKKAYHRSHDLRKDLYYRHIF